MRAIALIWTLAAAMLLAFSPAGNAAPTVVRIDAFSVDAMWRIAQASDPNVTRQATQDALVANRLLAGEARKRYGVAVLSPGQRVGFAREVAFDDQLTAALRSLYAKEIMRDIPDLDALVLEQVEVSDAALDAVLGKPGQLRLDTSFTAAQMEQARKLVLLRTARGPVTLFDIARRQNVQGRVAIYAHDRAFMQQQAKLQLASMAVLDWCRGRFGADAVADLRNALAEQDDARALQRMHGVGEEQHAGSALLDTLVKQVTDVQVRDYYRRHRDEFVRIEKVRARHIRVADEAHAQIVAQALAGGANFATVARRHSIATDAANGGSLGWVRHESTPDWMAQLVFSLAKGKVSPPVRMPGGPDDNPPWEIVLVEERVQGYQDLASETVRYVASRAIAREMAIAQLAVLRRELLRNVRVEVVRA